MSGSAKQHTDTPQTVAFCPILQSMEWVTVSKKLTLGFIQTTLQHDITLTTGSGPHLSLIMMLEGAGHYHLEGWQTVQHYQRQSLYLSCSFEHCQGTDFFPRNHFYHLIVMQFSAEMLPLVENCHPDYAQVHSAFVRPLALTMALKTVAQHIQTAFLALSPLSLLRLESLCLDALWQVINALLYGGDRLRVLTPSRRHPLSGTSHVRRRLIDARHYMQTHFHESLRLKDIAKNTGLSQTALKKGFREMFGLSPWNYVIECRVREAKRLLDNTSLPVGEIALRCGFSHASHLGRFFARLSGLSPWRYRCMKQGAADVRKPAEAPVRD